MMGHETGMKQDIVIGGVGGQGILALAAVVARAGLAAGLNIKQSEVHGMAQRGGAVVAHLRLSAGPVHSDLVPRGGADLVLAFEPLEALRLVPYLASNGALIGNTTPIRNLDGYPEVNDVYAALRALPRALLLDADALARAAGSPRAMNMVMLGAASAVLSLDSAMLEDAMAGLFRDKGAAVCEVNGRAFRAGAEAAAGLSAAVGRP
jgi:indolepyruvate ferredoxin oxidoreductase beta subunit